MENTPIQITSNEDGMRAERFIEKRFPQVPRGIRHKFFRTKKLAIFRNGKRQKLEKSFTLKKGDEIKIFFQPDEFGEKRENVKKLNFDSILKHPKLKKIKILWEDEHMLVVNKPAGIAVHPGSGIRFGHSLIDYVTALQKTKNINNPEPKLVHRLDKDTSGLVMISKNDGFLRKIITLLQTGKIKKRYYAIVKGELEKKIGTISEKISRKEGSKYTKISIDEKDGKDSITHYSVEKYYADKNLSLVNILLETGRMHQIRIHFSSNSHPLAGDQVYGDFKWNKILQKKYKLKRQALHAFCLEFIHPETDEKIKIESEMPNEILKICV